MYFNPQIKEKKEDFYNYEVLQEELKQAIDDQLIPMIAVFGLRRTGKTSLLRVVLSGIKRKHVWIDGREIMSREDFRKKLSEEAERLQKIKLRKINLKGIEIILNYFKEGLDFLNKHRAIIVIDEAQLLKAMGIDKSIAYIYDNYPKIKIILSGSEAGMLKSFLGINKPKASLYGRAVFELQTRRLAKESGFMFLMEGAKQAKLALREEDAREAISRLDGIIGWLTKYGWYRLKRQHKESLRKTIEEGKGITKKEFKKFSFRSEKKYKLIIRSIKEGAGWEEIKRTTGVSDKQLASMLKRLINYGFVEKRERIYYIADPLLEAAI